MDVDSAPPLLSLPSELIHHILGFLPLLDLLSVSRVNHALHDHSLQDTLYQPFVQANTGTTIKKPSNITWRELFKQHHPYWFIPQNKIWFADNAHTGKLLIARYDHRLNSIEGYALVAERRQPSFKTWDWNPEAIIHTFSPRVQLDLNAPIVRLDAGAYQSAVGIGDSRLQKELPMSVYPEPPRPSAELYSRLMLAKPWPSNIITQSTPVWPPLVLPSDVRARNDSPSQFRDLNHRPRRLSEISTKQFRIRKWMEFSSRPHGVSMRVGEDITTWATLPMESYTPTPQKPWQGIWCGDYAGHGCEFLVIMQPDDPAPLPERAEWVMAAREMEGEGSVSSDESWETDPIDVLDEEEQFEIIHSPESAMDLEDSVATLQATEIEEPPSSTSANFPNDDDEAIYRGRIEAVKLTGDPNIPRGEYTFIAPDIGQGGLIRVATEEMFRGARIVKSVGHIADRGFREDDYMASQLILISHDRLAQYWETFEHVSFYQRVDIDEFTKVP
ncbi:F-box domain-containing protein [Lophiotrema nucula]|uniref:F-box domain-containing protein n=1 Tax=Lophiotrema nucula TaxID=690887 RepID=A0A6A5YTH0_9PLEO|nr:F-box domain-containing protein [Lophiotrema nucula]